MYFFIINISLIAATGQFIEQETCRTVQHLKTVFCFCMKKQMTSQLWQSTAQFAPSCVPEDNSAGDTWGNK